MRYNIYLSIILLIIPNVILAVAPKDFSNLDKTPIETYYIPISKYILYPLIFLSFLGIIIGSSMFLFSKDNKAKRSRARDIFKFSIIILPISLIILFIFYFFTYRFVQ